GVKRPVAAGDAADGEPALVELCPLTDREDVGPDRNVSREVDLELERVGDAAHADRVRRDRARPTTRVPHREGRVAGLAPEAGVVIPRRRPLLGWAARLRPAGAVPGGEPLPPRP